MTNPIDDVAATFADAIAAGASGDLRDETGRGILVQAPLLPGGDAALGYNEALACWVLRVEHDHEHVAHDQFSAHLARLAELGGLTHFRIPQIAGLTAEGRVSISTLLPDGADRTAISELIALSLAELCPPGTVELPEGQSIPLPRGRMLYA